ncbi:hypothetical protein DFH09DRAFT_1325404 [Mycena vulgaris]|nr:hypothetical protein DFH09DRAFT_1325404 [Mycena vulgaris]
MSGLLDKGKEFLSSNSGSAGNTSTQGNQGSEDYVDKDGFLSCLDAVEKKEGIPDNRHTIFSRSCPDSDRCTSRVVLTHETLTNSAPIRPLSFWGFRSDCDRRGFFFLVLVLPDVVSSV